MEQHKKSAIDVAGDQDTGALIAQLEQGLAGEEGEQHQTGDQGHGMRSKPSGIINDILCL